MRWFETLRHDFAYAIRSLSRAPAFALPAAATLAIGVGAATAIASVVHSVLLQALPYPAADRLVRVIEWMPHLVAGRPPIRRGVTYQEFVEWQRRATTIDEAAAVIAMGQRMVLTSRGAAGLWGAMVSGSAFSLFGGRAMLGRILGPADEASPEVVVLSHDTWQRHFDADEQIVGRSVTFRAGGFPAPQLPPRALTVVGVLAPGVALPTGHADYYIPVALDPARPSPGVTMIGRLSPGVTLAAAVDEANAIGNAIVPPRRTDAPGLQQPRFAVEPLKDQLVRPLRPALGMLLGAVVIVLLLVCANVANLLLARGTARRREIAVRVAIGASRGRLVQHVLAESMVLALIGGLLGAVLGAGGVTLVKQLATLETPGFLRLVFGTTILPRANEVEVDLGVLAIALALAAAACVIFGVLPALDASRTSHRDATGTRGGGSTRREVRIRASLAVAQLAMATVLLVGAGLLVQSFVRLARDDKGFEPSQVLTFQLLFSDAYSVARRAETIDVLLARLRAAPDVRAAGFARHGILITEELFIGTFVPPGRALSDMTGDPQRSRVRSVSPGFLSAMGVPLLDGRELRDTDGATAPPVIVINRAAAQKYFGTERAVGQELDWHLGEHSVQATVVGVVEDVRNESLAAERYPEIFVEFRQLLFLLDTWGHPASRQLEAAIGLLSFAVRTRDDPAAAVPTVRQIVSSVDPAIGIDSILPMERMVANSTARQRFHAVILGVFAAVAAMLAAIGVYGVLAYTVAQRTQEIGVRMALGARRVQVLRLILGHGALMSMLGIGLGIGGAALATRYLEGMLFGITPLDTPTFAAVAIGFALVAVAASYLPARKATGIEPIVALRSE